MPLIGKGDVIPLGNFGAGPYTAAHTPMLAGVAGSPETIHLTEDGWRSRVRILEDQIDRSDAYGRSLIDAVFEGCRGGVTTTFIEWRASMLKMTYPWAYVLPLTATKFIVVNAAAPIGRLGSDNAGSLVLTAVANTPAATYGPATVTFGKIKAAPDQDIEFYYGPGHRKYSMNFDLLLYASSSDFILYSAT